MPSLRGRGGAAYRGMKRRHIADQMIRRQHQHQRVWVFLLQHQRGHSNRGRGVASHRLEHYRLWLDFDLAQLLGHHETVLGVAHHQRCGHFRHAS